MMTLKEIQEDRNLVNSIDWEMSPEDAVTLYLEWGNNWNHGKMVRSKKDVSYYFLVNTWEEPARIYLIRRNSEEAKELAEIEIPEPLRSRFLASIAKRKSIYALNDELKTWLRDTIESYNGPLQHQHICDKRNFRTHNDIF